MAEILPEYLGKEQKGLNLLNVISLYFSGQDGNVEKELSKILARGCKMFVWRKRSILNQRARELLSFNCNLVRGISFAPTPLPLYIQR
jgi:hypothetical protein